MTLHESILQVLRLRNVPKSPEWISEEINSLQLYKKEDGTPLTSGQILLRVKNYPRLFSIDENNRISLGIQSKEILSYYYRDLSDILRRKGINNSLDTLKFLFYLRIRAQNLKDYFRSSKNTYAQNTSSFILYELMELNKENEINGIFDYIIKTLKDSEVFEISELVNFVETVDFSEKEFPNHFFYDFFLDELNKTFGRIKNRISLPHYASQFVCAFLRNKKSIYFPFGDLEAFKFHTDFDIDTKKENLIIFESQDNEIVDFAQILKILKNEDKNIVIHRSQNEYDVIKSAEYTDCSFGIIPAGKKILVPHTLNYFNTKKNIIAYENYIIDAFANNILLGTLKEAFLIVTESFLFSSKKENVELRSSLINRNLLKAVISLPDRLFYPISGLKTSLVILKNSDLPKDSGVIFFEAKGLNEDNTSFYIQKINNALYKKISEDEYFVCNSVETLKSKNYILSVNLNLSYKNSIPSKFAFNEEFVSLNYLIKNYFKGRNIPSTYISNNRTHTPLIRVNNLNEEAGGLRINLNSVEKFVDQDYASSVIKFHVPENSILLATHGMSLKATLFNQKKEAFINTNIICIVPNLDMVLPEYMLIQFKERYFIDQIEAIRNTVLIPYITITALLKLKIKVTSIPEQEKEVSAYKSQVLSQFENVIQVKEELSKESEFKIFRAFKHELGNRSSELNNYLQTLQLHLEKIENEKSLIDLNQKIGNFSNAPSINELFNNIYNVQSKISTSFLAVQNVFDFQIGPNKKSSINIIDYIQKIIQNSSSKNIKFNILFDNL